jgi:hypothetical protein
MKAEHWKFASHNMYHEIRPQIGRVIHVAWQGRGGASPVASLSGGRSFRAPYTANESAITLSYEATMTKTEATPLVDAVSGGNSPRRIGKRKLPDAREKWIHTRCNDAEHATITAAAAQAGLSAGAYLRFLGTGTAGPRAVRRPPVERAELTRMLGELGKLGSNVNQLARTANTGGDQPTWWELTAIGEEVRTMRAAVMKALGHGD